MRESGRGSGIFRGLLMIAGVAVLLVVVFYAGLIAIGVAVIFFTVRGVVRALSGRGQAPYFDETVAMAPEYRATRTQSSATAQPIYVLPPQPTTSAS
jgi:hypothetical protein